MASYNFFFFFFFISFLSSAKAQVDDYYFIDQNCPNQKINAGTSFQTNLETLFSSLTNATNDSKFYNTTIIDHKNPSNCVYGIFMCRGDIPSYLCHQCVQIATQQLLSECSLNKQAIIWYNQCMVRYSNHHFFSTMITTPKYPMTNSALVFNPETFMRLLELTMNQTSDEASLHHNKYATKQAIVSNSTQTLYCLAQCTPDLSPHDCRTCLSSAITELSSFCDGKIGGRVLYPSCNIRYELYPFYFFSSITPSLVPSTDTSRADSIFSYDDLFLSENCSTDHDHETFANGPFQIQLTKLLSYLSSNATSSNFGMASVANVHGIFMCQHGLPSQLCGQCVHHAAQQISSQCRSVEAIVWYSHCMIRYSSQQFFSTLSTSPKFSKLNITSSAGSRGQNLFVSTLAITLDEVAYMAKGSEKRYGTKSLKLNDKQTLYTLAQCTLDLSSSECWTCLEYILGTEIQWTRLGSVGGRVLYPSCNLRFELFNFYGDGDEATLQPTSDVSTHQGIKSNFSVKIILIVVIIFISVMVFSSGYYIHRRKTRTRKSYKIILKENFGHESAALESLIFNLAEIKAATNNFSNENKIGKGGFGEVYKGFLDGQQIAVKRLSRSSKQGANEFKNEILLIAKLQHKNLVKLIGFCLEEQEKILIYEYLSNKSLNYFLFDSQREKLLSWSERYNIISGIASGVLYLHEHSRLKVIHRDLKSSNILLDENMNPKISDFGLARIVETNQDQENTNIIVGTFGYMSPEYAMFGQFSEKSDIYSFGVMVLEIVTGKKNRDSYDNSHRIADGLLTYVWRQWNDQTSLTILDPNIEENYSVIEVLRCIQIGLLCVQQNPETRPTMMMIVSYLSNHVIELPTPQEPAFFLHDRMDPTTISYESISAHSINNSIQISTNEMSMSFLDSNFPL